MKILQSVASVIQGLHAEEQIEPIEVVFSSFIV